MEELVAVPIALEDLHESAWNPRKHFPQAPLESLAQSMREVGVLAPLLVRPRPGGGYEIASGHRRRRAAALAKLTHVPAIVKQLTDEQLLDILTIENLQREDVHPLDEAEGYRIRMKETKASVEAVSARIGKSVSYIYQRLKLAEMTPKAKEAFLADEISAGHAILLARLQPKDQAEALKNIFDVDGYGYMRRMRGEGPRTPCSVRALAHWIEENIHLDLSGAAWKKDDATLVPDAGPCTTCPKRTGFAPDLFPDVAKKDTCTDRSCYQAKAKAFIARKLADAEKAGEKVAQISTNPHYMARKKETGLLYENQYVEAKAGSCPHVRKAIIVEGRGLGQAKTICSDRSCKEHAGRHHSTGGGDPYARQQKEAARKKVLRTALLTEILRQTRGKILTLKRGDLETIALAFFVDVWHESQKAIVRLEGWETAAKKLSRSYLTELVLRLPKMNDRELYQFLFTLSHARALMGFGYGYGEKVKPETRLREAAKRLGVNVAALEKAQRTQEADRIREKKARETKAKKKAKSQARPASKKPRAKEKSSVESYPEPTCVKCKCTQGAPCPGGCSWVKLDKKTNAGLCSKCAPKAKKAPVHTSAKAKV